MVLEYLRHAVSAQSRVSTPREAWVLDSQPGVVPAEVGADVRRVIDAVEVRSSTIRAAKFSFGARRQV